MMKLSCDKTLILSCISILRGYFLTRKGIETYVYVFLAQNEDPNLNNFIDFSGRNTFHTYICICNAKYFNFLNIFALLVNCWICVVEANFMSILKHTKKLCIHMIGLAQTPRASSSLEKLFKEPDEFHACGNCV